jgi:hypothetical protein
MFETNIIDPSGHLLACFVGGNAAREFRPTQILDASLMMTATTLTSQHLSPADLTRGSGNDLWRAYRHSRNAFGRTTPESQGGS